MRRPSLRLARKLAHLSRRASYRRALRDGVAAAVEHERVPFEHDFRTVIDVGANRGQFALVAGRLWPGARLICFEPLPDAQRLLHKVIGPRERFTVIGAAAGETDGEAVLHVAARDDSSSLLDPTPLLESEFPETGAVDELTVPVRPLDAAIGAEDLERPALLKIDVQGAELGVLRGAPKLLGELDEILVEASFAELYGGQPMADEVVVFAHEAGFGLAGVYSVTYGHDGRCLQADLHFTRSRPDSPPAG